VNETIELDDVFAERKLLDISDGIKKSERKTVKY